MIDFDTNFLIQALLKGTPEEAILRELLLTREPLAMSALAWGEFLCGPLKPEDRVLAERLFPSIEAVSVTDADLGARLFNLTGRKSRTFVDCLIAAVAIRRGARLATNNTTDFTPFCAHGLVLH